MNIELIKVREGWYRADCKDCPGTPPVGNGKTEADAMAALFYMMIFSSTGGGNPTNWLPYIKEGKPIVINGKVWEDPCNMKR